MTNTFPNEVRALLTNLGDLLVEKNKAYGNSALEPKRVFSKASNIEGIKVRIDDKLSRIANKGYDGDGKEDTLIDLIGYLVLLKLALNDKDNKETKIKGMEELPLLVGGVCEAHTVQPIPLTNSYMPDNSTQTWAAMH